MQKRRLDIYTPEDSLGGLGKDYKVFLAGPIQGAPEWQFEVPKIPGVVWLSPRRYDYTGFDYKEQIEWETTGLRIADLVLFWIPEPIERIPGRDYAQTTRTEFGEILGRRSKDVVLGCYRNFPGREYLSWKIGYYKPQSILESLEECIKEIPKKQEPKIFFTSDTHFGSSRALELSKRPFRNTKDMDWTIIERWNSRVKPWDIVYHLGDFGDPWPTDFLNGEIHLIPGNYEENSLLPDNIILEDKIYKLRDYVMSHKPGDIKDLEGRKLFGHIHGRSLVKPWNGLDVGIDCHNYYPISEDEVKFYLNAIEKGYYDSEVWG